MTGKALNERLIEVLKQRIPDNTAIMNKLMDELHLGKEAIYRRVRGDVPFTLLEAFKIALMLQTSLDQILLSKPEENNILFKLRLQKFYFETENEEEYLPLQEFLESLKQIAEEPKSEFAFSSSIFPLFPGHLFFELFKFSTFKYLYETKDIGIQKTYNEINVPLKFFKLNQDVNKELMNIKKTSYFFHSRLWEHMIDELRYFRGIHLMTSDDIEMIKTEMHNFLNFFEKITIKGQFDNGNKVEVYISDVRFDASYSYLEAGNYRLSMLGIFTISHVTASSELAMKRMKEKIQLLKRTSTLISDSGAMQRIEFMAQQRRLIDSLK